MPPEGRKLPQRGCNRTFQRARVGGLLVVLAAACIPGSTLVLHGVQAVTFDAANLGVAPLTHAGRTWRWHHWTGGRCWWRGAGGLQLLLLLPLKLQLQLLLLFSPLPQAPHGWGTGRVG